MKYKNSRKKIWERLTKAIVVRVEDSAYIIKAETYHKIKAQFFLKD